jgi:hypothetical protein
MTLRDWIRLAFRPPAEASKLDTGLRFTDILFGFVIKELFTRLQSWSDWSEAVRWQLVAATALILGSWIGFRRSLNRTGYEVKFFNLPFCRFILDQLMVILYFRIAVLTPPSPPKKPIPIDNLMDATMTSLVIVFVLYAIWDFGGIWMARAREPSGALKYPEIDKETNEKTTAQSIRDVPALVITLCGLGLIGGLHFLARATIGRHHPVIMFISAAILLVLYRFAKEIKTSWQRMRPTLSTLPPASPSQ